LRFFDYFAIDSFDDWIIQQPEILYGRSVANGYKDAVNGKTAMNFIAVKIYFCW